MLHVCKNISVHIFAIKKVLIMLDFLKLFALSLSFFRTTRANQTVLCTKLPTTCEFDTCPCGSFKCVCVCVSVCACVCAFVWGGPCRF